MSSALNHTPLKPVNFFSVDFAMIDGKPVIHELNPMAYSGGDPELLQSKGYASPSAYVEASAQTFAQDHLDGIPVYNTLSDYLKAQCPDINKSDEEITELVATAYATMVSIYSSVLDGLFQEDTTIIKTCLERFGDTSLDSILKDPELRLELIDFTYRCMSENSCEQYNNHYQMEGLELLKTLSQEGGGQATAMILRCDNVSKDWQAALPGLAHLANVHFPNHADPFTELAAINKGVAALTADIAYDKTPDYLPKQSLVLMDKQADNIQRAALKDRFGDGPVIYKPLVAASSTGCQVYESVESLLDNMPEDYHEVYDQYDMSDKFAYDGNRFIKTSHPFGLIQSVCASDPIEIDGEEYAPSYRIFAQCYTDEHGKHRVIFPDDICIENITDVAYDGEHPTTESVVQRSYSEASRLVTGDMLESIKDQFSVILPDIMERYDALNMETLIYKAATSKSNVNQLYSMFLTANEALYQPCITPDSGFCAAMSVSSHLPVMQHPIAQDFSSEVYDALQARLDAIFPDRPPEHIRNLENALTRFKLPISVEAYPQLEVIYNQLIEDISDRQEKIQDGEKPEDIRYYKILYDMLNPRYYEDVAFNDGRSASEVIKQFLDVIEAEYDMERDDFEKYEYQKHGKNLRTYDIDYLSQALLNNAAACTYLGDEHYKTQFLAVQQQIAQALKNDTDFLPIENAMAKIEAINTRDSVQDVAASHAEKAMERRAASGFAARE